MLRVRPPTWFCLTLMSLAALSLVLLGPRPVQAQGARRGAVSVIIDSNPPGATVYVDSRDHGPAGTAGPHFSVKLSRGDHHIYADLEGYARLDRLITVDNDTPRVLLELRQAAGTIEVRTTASNRDTIGAAVLVDGQAAGTVPARLDVKPGTHDVEVRKLGFRSFRETITLHGGETITKWVALQARSSGPTLWVYSDVKQAEVFVDGQPRGPAPARVEGLSEGDHRVEVRRADGQPGQPWIEIKRVGGAGPQQVTAHFGGGGPQAQYGSLLVRGNGDAGGDVLVDGVVRGRVNQPITGLRPGQHYFEVRGKSATVAPRSIEISAGQQRVELIESPADLQHGTGILRVIMVNPLDGASYYINGRLYDEAAILSERGVEVGAGLNIVVVRKEGFGEQRRQVNMKPGGYEPVTIDVENTGQVQVFSDPRGAYIYFDNGLVGQTPKVLDAVPAGPHKIELRAQGYKQYIEQVIVHGGDRPTVNKTLDAEDRPRPDDAWRRRGLTSYSAVSIPPGSFTADLGVGYPYFFDLRLTVGMIKIKSFGIDAGAELRTTFYETDVGANLRVQLLQIGPIALGTSAWIGGGGGPRSRNSFTFELGVPVTLVAGNMVKLTVRPYMQYYSDRLCPSQQEIQQLASNGDLSSLLSLIQPEHVGDRCASSEDDSVTPPIPARYVQNAIADAAGINPVTGNWLVPNNPGQGAKYNPNLPIYQQDGTPVLSRFNGVRFMLQSVVELAISPSASLWLLIEGAPGQGQRQQYTDKFNRIFPINDYPLYGRVGYTAKF